MRNRTVLPFLIGLGLAAITGCAAPQTAQPSAAVPVSSGAATAAAPPPAAPNPAAESGAAVRYALGRPDAPVTVDEFADFQCSGCGYFARSIEPEFRKRFIDTGKVKLVWHDFPWIGQESRQAAQAARCAGAQGKFWDYHDYLYHHQRGENQGQFSAENLRRFAGDVGLDTGAFGDCLTRGADLPLINQEFAQARALKLNATPSFSVNGRLLSGAPTLDGFARLIDAEIARKGG